MRLNRPALAAGLLALAVAGLLGARTWADDPPPPAPTNGTVSFHGFSTLTDAVKVSLAVCKPGRPCLVNGNPGEGQIDGSHTFPAGTTPGAMAAYYALLLSNAGWTQPPTVPADFTVKDGVISFVGITGLDGGSNNQRAKVDGATDSKDVPFGGVDPDKPPKKKLAMLRPGDRGAGTITVVAFGIHWNQGDTITTSTSVIHVPFEETDSAAAVLGKIRDAMVAADWGATIDASGKLEMSTNGHGDRIYSIYHDVDYSTGPSDDHWIWLSDD